MRKLTYWLVGLLLIGIATLAVLLLNNIREITWQAAENAVCEATVADQGGVDINSAFRFTFEGDVSANAVRRFLTVEPAVELNFHQGIQAREVLAVPVEPLQTGIIYHFRLATEREDLCWAFQTKQEWRVESSLPAHTTTAVDPDAVLAIYFNQSLSVDLAALADYLSISPAIDGYFEQEGACLRFVPQQPWAAATVYTVRLDAGLPAMSSDLTLAADYEFAFETAGVAGGVSVSGWDISVYKPCFLPSQAPSFTCNLGAVTLPQASDAEQAAEGPKITTSLYRYADAAAYAADLLARQTYAPQWSMQGRYPQGASTEELTWLSLQEIAPQLQPYGSYSFSWPGALPPGCYLLKAIYQGQIRDVRFQVSGLTALVQAADDQSLVWAHDTASGQPAADCAVTYINGGQEARADDNGLTRMALEHNLLALDAEGLLQVRQDIYVLRYGQQELVVEDIWPEPTAGLGSTDIWQYLRLSQESYQSGDTLEFWGYMRRRDNSDWDWSRVSVYICAKDAPDQPVTQGYAPLTNNTFYGSVELPRLLPGEYQLQIWQSGQMLLAKSFVVDMSAIRAGDDTALIYMRTGSDDFFLSSDKDTYALNESYTLKLAGGQNGPVLFVKSGGGLREAVVETEALHYGLFGVEDYGGAYWQAVSFNGESYQITLPLSLKADSSVHALQVEMETQPNRGAGETTLGFTLRDVTGAVPAKTGLLALVAAPGLAEADILEALYAPNRLSGLSLFPEPVMTLETEGWPAPSAYTQGETLLFTPLEVDKNGRAELSLTLPPGEWQVYAWAVADAALPLAGSATLVLGGTTGQSVTPAVELSKDEATPYHAWATRYDMSVGNSHLIRDGLLFFSSTARVQAMELLWPPLFSANISAEQRLGSAYARMLWQRHGYAGYTLPPDATSAALGVLQQADGGIAADENGSSELLFSMLTAALIRDGIKDFDAAALARYLQSRAASSAPVAERAMALAGLATLDKPVLQELKLLLAQVEQVPLVRTCLIWGLAQAGDMQVAKVAFHDFLDAYASDATSGSFYLEGGQGENIRLNRISAILAAACGDDHTAFALAGYLQNQQAYDELTAALAAGGLLSSTYAQAASATLLLDGRDYRVEIAAFNDIWLEQQVSENLLVEEVKGDLAMTCLRVGR